jgi:hypothetical protein
MGEASDAINAVEPIDAARASGFVSSVCPQATSTSLGSCHPAWGAHVRPRLLEALRQGRAVDERSLPACLHGVACPRTPPSSRRSRGRLSRCRIPCHT